MTNSTVAPMLLPLVTALWPLLPPSAAASIDETYRGGATTFQNQWWARTSSEATAEVPSKMDRGLGQLVVPFTAPAWLVGAGDKLQSFIGLPDNWKGPGTAAPSVQAILEASDLLSQFASEVAGLPGPAISPDEDGAICIHWRVPGLLATITAYGDETYSFFAEGGGKASRADSEPVGRPLSVDLISVLVNGLPEV